MTCVPQDPTTTLSNRGSVRVDRLYKLERQASPMGKHTFEIEFVDPGVHANAFTFG